MTKVTPIPVVEKKKYYYFPNKIKEEIRSKLPPGYSLSTNPIESIVICTQNKISDQNIINFDERIIEWLYRDYKLHAMAAFICYDSICVGFEPRSEMKKDKELEL